MDAFFDSQLKYCPLIWMCHSRTNNRKIDKLHERGLRVIYNNKRPSFKGLLEKDGAVAIHERNVQMLATEIYKISNNFTPSYMNKIWGVMNITTIKDKTLSFSYLGP